MGKGGGRGGGGEKKSGILAHLGCGWVQLGSRIDKNPILRINLSAPSSPSPLPHTIRFLVPLIDVVGDVRSYIEDCNAEVVLQQVLSRWYQKGPVTPPPRLEDLKKGFKVRRVRVWGGASP